MINENKKRIIKYGLIFLLLFIFNPILIILDILFNVIAQKYNLVEALQRIYIDLIPSTVYLIFLILFGFIFGLASSYIYLLLVNKYKNKVLFFIGYFLIASIVFYFVTSFIITGIEMMIGVISFVLCALLDKIGLINSSCGF